MTKQQTIEEKIKEILAKVGTSGLEGDGSFSFAPALSKSEAIELAAQLSQLFEAECQKRVNVIYDQLKPRIAELKEQVAKVYDDTEKIKQALKQREGIK